MRRYFTYAFRPGSSLGLLLMIVTISSCRSGGRPASEVSWERFEFSEPQMGLPFRIILYAPNQAKADEAARAAFDRIERLNRIFSDYETDSELNELAYRSGTGEAVAVSPDLWNVLARAQRLAVQTEGAFDVTVGPYVGLWRKARREKSLPEPGRLKESGARVGYEKMVLDPKRRTVLLRAEEMRLDLGGNAKGYALDAAALVLREEHGLHRILVSGGGDMVAGDPPPGQTGWRIEIAPLEGEGAPAPQVVLLKRRALATSGDVFQHLEIEGRRYSHIVDPRTGLGLTDQSQVTVIAEDGMTADSLATAVSVLGPDRGMRLIEATRGAEAYVVRKPGDAFEEYRSTGFDRYLLKTKDD